MTDRTVGDNQGVTDPRPALLPALLAGGRAPAPSTLVEIFRHVVEAHGDAPAVHAGAEVLSYTALEEAASEVASRLAAIGTGPGTKIGVRISSGTTDLYVAILGILLAGAAYVPVDADDPDERARVVFEESAALAVIGDGLVITLTTAGPAPLPAGSSPGGFGPATAGASSTSEASADGPGAADAPVAPLSPSPDDDAWVIFTSGSTGRPKGVAVSHRSAEIGRAHV